jgi:hypothetical protein
MSFNDVNTHRRDKDRTVSTPHKTDDALGYDLEDLRLATTTATATLGQPAPAEQLPTRKHDGPAPPELAERDRRAALEKLGISVAQQAAAVRHVRLDMRRAYVAGRGNVNLIRTWHVWSDVPRADWVSWLDISNYGGIIEMWFRGLTANRQYFFDIAVTGWWRNTSSAFKVSSSAGFYANFPTSQNSSVQHLYGVLRPTSNLALVRLEPIELTGLSFYHTELWPI